MAQQIESKSFRDFWTNIKKIKGNNKLIANVVYDKYTDSDIADHFCQKYDHLFNSVPDNEFENIETKIDNLINENCCKNKCKSNHCHTISEEIMKKAISCLKNDKDEEITTFLATILYMHQIYFTIL